MVLHRAKLSTFKIKKIMRCFCLDLTATQTSKLLGFNRKTANRYYAIFRRVIAQYQHDEFQKFVGLIELDESYFGAKRIRVVDKIVRKYTLSRYPFSFIRLEFKVDEFSTESFL